MHVYGCAYTQGQRGIYAASSGVVIAYLSGRHDYSAYRNSSAGSQMVCTCKEVYAYRS